MGAEQWVIAALVLACGAMPFDTSARAQDTNVLSLVSSAIEVPAGLALDARQRLFVSDAEHGNIFQMWPSGRLTMEAEGFEEPRDFAFDNQGNLFVADAGAGTLYRLDKLGRSTTLATGLAGVCCVALDVDGSVLVLHQPEASNTYAIIRINQDGEQMKVAAGFVDARGMVVDQFGNLIVAATGYAGVGTNDVPSEIGSGLFQVDATGSVTRLIDLGSITATGLTLGPQGAFLFAGLVESNGTLFVTQDGTFQPLASGFVAPHGIAANRQNVFVADEATGRIWRVPLAPGASVAGNATVVAPAAAQEASAEETISLDEEAKQLSIPQGSVNQWGYYGKPDYSKIPVTRRESHRRPTVSPA